MTTVLIITRSDDNECIERVSAAIARRGGDVIRFDTDRYPTDLQLTAESGPDPGRWLLRRGAEARELQGVAAVWYRRLRAGAGIPETMEPPLRKASIEESRASLIGMIASLPVFQMDPFSIVRHASIKPLQLQVARKCGLETPRTLVSNDPVEVRAFAGTCPQGMVAKMLSSFHVFDEGVEKVVFTSPVSAEALERMDGLRFSPMTFQERIPKMLELRVTIVGDRIFAAAVDSVSLERAGEDWRREGQALIQSWQHYTLPENVQRGLLGIMDHFRLNYGAIDLIVTPDNRHVFLEINPVGEYFWLEMCPGLLISEAIADVLLDRAPRRTPVMVG